jgi:hypothetical protein
VALSAVALLLAGCTGSPMPVPTGPPPPFLATTDDGTHALPPEISTRLDLDPSTVRYQGEWKGRSVFLAQSNRSTSAKYKDSCVLVGTIDGDDDFADACGRNEFAVSLLTYGTFRYDPDGYPNGLDGYTPLGAWIAVGGGKKPTPTPAPAG